MTTENTTLHKITITIDDKILRQAVNEYLNKHLMQKSIDVTMVKRSKAKDTWIVDCIYNQSTKGDEIEGTTDTPREWTEEEIEINRAIPKS